MDRLISQRFLKRFAVILVMIAAIGILIFKAINEGWFMPRESLDLSTEPTLLFFNRSKGCECALVVYEATDRQIKSWPEEAYSGIKIIRIDMDRRPDLGKQFIIIRAPALVLVDSNGLSLFKQTESVSDTFPLNLFEYEQAIKEFQNGK